MFSKIMCPVDLAHLADLRKAQEVAGRIGRERGAEIVYCGIAPTVPGGAGHSPKEDAENPDALAREQGDTYGVSTSARTIPATDPVANVDKLLRDAAQVIHPDLIVTGTHTPDFTDQVWASHGRHLAQATDASIFLARGDK